MINYVMSVFIGRWISFFLEFSYFSLFPIQLSSDMFSGIVSQYLGVHIWTQINGFRKAKMRRQFVRGFTFIAFLFGDINAFDKQACTQISIYNLIHISSLREHLLLNCRKRNESIPCILKNESNIFRVGEKLLCRFSENTTVTCDPKKDELAKQKTKYGGGASKTQCMGTYPVS